MTFPEVSNIGPVTAAISYFLSLPMVSIVQNAGIGRRVIK
jgi:hypothetical protein